MAVNRHTLAVNKLPLFKEYLIKNEWEIQPIKGEYEVLRATHKNRKFPLIVYKRLATNKGTTLIHLSVLDRDMVVIRKFLRSKYDKTADD